MKYSLSIHEAHGEIPDYNRPRIHLSWAQNWLSKTKSLQLNNHEAFLYLWKIFLEHEHHDIPEFCLSTTSGNHTINHVCHTDRNILTQSGKMFAYLTWTKCHQITLAQLLLLSPHKSSNGTVDLFKIPARFERDTRGWPSKQFLTKSLAWSEICINVALAEQMWVLQTTFWGQTLVTTHIKALQYDAFLSQARDQCLTRLAKMRQKMVTYWTMADFANHETCSFIRLNDAFRKTLLQAAKVKSRKLTDHGKQLVPHVLISNLIVFYDTERIMGNDRWGGGEGGDGNSIMNTLSSCLLQFVRGFFCTESIIRKKNGQVLNKPQMRLLLKKSWR